MKFTYTGTLNDKPVEGEVEGGSISGDPFVAIQVEALVEGRAPVGWGPYTGPASLTDPMLARATVAAVLDEDTASFDGDRTPVGDAPDSDAVEEAGVQSPQMGMGDGGNGAVLNPTRSLEAFIEATAESDAPTTRRVRELVALREDLEQLNGRIDRALTVIESRDTGQPARTRLDLMEARENADLREELLRRELADEAGLDSIGYVSHEVLDRCIELGVLEEALGRFAGLTSTAFEKLHPRGRGGKFMEKPGGKPSTPTAPAPTKRMQRKGRRQPVFRVFPTPSPKAAGPLDVVTKTESSTIPEGMSAAQYREMRRREAVTGATKRSRLSGDVSQRRREERIAEFERNVATELERASAATPAELHFNERGRVSQESLLRYASEARTQPTTAEQYSQRNADGTLTFDETRRQLHEHIIETLLPETIPSQAEPKVLFLGGGYGAGKSSTRRRLGGEDPLPGTKLDVPGDAALVDADLVKAMLPEFQFLSQNENPEANLNVYEEAVHVTQEIQRQARERRVNVILDGLNNTSADAVSNRVNWYREAGYEPSLAYVTTDPDVAAERVATRAREASRPEDRRHIPDVIARSAHRDLNAMLPELMQRADAIGARVEVFENRNDAEPKLIAHADPGTGKKDPITVVDKGGWLTAVDRGRRGLSVEMGEVEDSIESDLVQMLTDEERELPASSLQRHGTIDALYDRAPEVQDTLEALLDRGSGVDRDLSAESISLDEPGAYERAKQTVSDNQDKSHVIIGAMKDRDKAQRKVESKYGGDASRLSDVVRATILTPTAGEMAAALETVRQKAQEHGMKISAVENKFAHTPGLDTQPGPTPEGYRDFAIKLETADGFQSELQFNVTPLWVGKEVDGAYGDELSGHGLYEEIREITRRAPEDGEISIEEGQKLAELRHRATRMYARAWAQSLENEQRRRASRRRGR